MQGVIRAQIGRSHVLLPLPRLLFACVLPATPKVCAWCRKSCGARTARFPMYVFSWIFGSFIYFLYTRFYAGVLKELFCISPWPPLPPTQLFLPYLFFVCSFPPTRWRTFVYNRAVASFFPSLCCFALLVLLFLSFICFNQAIAFPHTHTHTHMQRKGKDTPHTAASSLSSSSSSPHVSSELMMFAEARPSQRC